MIQVYSIRRKDSTRFNLSFELIRKRNRSSRGRQSCSAKLIIQTPDHRYYLYTRCLAVQIEETIRRDHFRPTKEDHCRMEPGSKRVLIEGNGGKGADIGGGSGGGGIIRGGSGSGRPASEN